MLQFALDIFHNTFSKFLIPLFLGVLAQFLGEIFFLGFKVSKVVKCITIVALVLVPSTSYLH